MSEVWIAQRISRTEHGGIDTWGPYSDREEAWHQMMNTVAKLAAEGLTEDDTILDAMTADLKAHQGKDRYQAGQVLWYIWDLTEWYGEL